MSLLVTHQALLSTLDRQRGAAEPLARSGPRLLCLANMEHPLSVSRNTCCGFALRRSSGTPSARSQGRS